MVCLLGDSLKKEECAGLGKAKNRTLKTEGYGTQNRSRGLRPAHPPVLSGKSAGLTCLFGSYWFFNKTDSPTTEKAGKGSVLRAGSSTNGTGMSACRRRADIL
jgi:hypothetical protein